MNPLPAVRGLGGVALLVALWLSGRRKRERNSENPVPGGRAGGQPTGSGGEEPRAGKWPRSPELTEEDLRLLAPYVAQGLIVGKEVVGLHEDPFLPPRVGIPARGT